jgi:hypothetical protein
MRKKATWGLLAGLVLLVGLAGCATFSNTPATSEPGMAAYQKAQAQSLSFMSWYKAQFNDAASMGALAQQGKLSVGQVQVYRVKRDLLIKAKPLIEAYDAIVAGGGVPSADREQEILDLINRLAAAG